MQLALEEPDCIGSWYLITENCDSSLKIHPGLVIGHDDARQFSLEPAHQVLALNICEDGNLHIKTSDPGQRLKTKSHALLEDIAVEPGTPVQLNFFGHQMLFDTDLAYVADRAVLELELVDADGAKAVLELEPVREPTAPAAQQRTGSATARFGWAAACCVLVGAMFYASLKSGEPPPSSAETAPVQPSSAESIPVESVPVASPPSSLTAAAEVTEAEGATPDIQAETKQPLFVPVMADSPRVDNTYDGPDSFPLDLNLPAAEDDLTAKNDLSEAAEAEEEELEASLAGELRDENETKEIKEDRGAKEAENSLAMLAASESNRKQESLPETLTDLQSVGSEPLVDSETVSASEPVAAFRNEIPAANDVGPAASETAVTENPLEQATTDIGADSADIQEAVNSDIADEGDETAVSSSASDPVPASPGLDEAMAFTATEETALEGSASRNEVDSTAAQSQFDTSAQGLLALNETLEAEAIEVSLSELNAIVKNPPRFPRVRSNSSISVEADFSVDTAGMVQNVEVRGDPPQRYKRAVVEAVADWRFEPYLQTGIAREVRTSIRITFRN